MATYDAIPRVAEIAEMLKFSRATYMSATPIEREFLLDELQTLPTTRIV